MKEPEITLELVGDKVQMLVNGVVRRSYKPLKSARLFFEANHDYAESLVKAAFQLGKLAEAEKMVAGLKALNPENVK